jgi:hypothetical protein
MSIIYLLFGKLHVRFFVAIHLTEQRKEDLFNAIRVHLEDLEILRAGTTRVLSSGIYRHAVWWR